MSPPGVADEVARLKSLHPRDLRTKERMEWLLQQLVSLDDDPVLLEDVRWLTVQALDGAEGMAILRDHFAVDYFQQGLVSPSAIARELACDQLLRMATPEDVDKLLGAGLLPRLADLVADEHLAVANRARRCLVAAMTCCAQGDLPVVGEVIDRLLQLASSESREASVVRLRALETIVRLASAQDQLFACLVDRGGLARVVGAWYASDILIRSSVLELLLDLAMTTRGLRFMESHGTILQDVLAVLHTNATAAVDTDTSDTSDTALLLVPVLDFVSRLSALGSEHRVVLATHGAVEAVCASLGHAPDDHAMAATVRALAALVVVDHVGVEEADGDSGQSQGLGRLRRALHAPDTVPALTSLLGGEHTPAPLRAAAMECLAVFLRSAAKLASGAGGDTAVELQAMVRSLEILAKTTLPRTSGATLVQSLLRLVNGPEASNRRGPALVMAALATYEQGALLLVANDAAIAWVCEPPSDEVKRSISTCLVEQPAVAARLSAAVRDALKAASQGGTSHGEVTSTMSAQPPGAHAAVVDEVHDAA